MCQDDGSSSSRFNNIDESARLMNIPTDHPDSWLIPGFYVALRRWQRCDLYIEKPKGPTCQKTSGRLGGRSPKLLGVGMASTGLKEWQLYTFFCYDISY